MRTRRAVSRSVSAYLTAVCATLMLWPAPCRADDGADFYRGKQIVFTVGFAAGETYDIYARVTAVYLPRYIPGQPAVIVKNLPGTGGLKTASYIALQAPRDGTAIGMSTQSLALEAALKNPAAPFDVRTINWIGRLAPILQFIVATQSSPVKTFEDAMRTEISLAATSPSGMTFVIPQVLNHLAGAKFKIIPGYTTGALLALERGEVESATMTVTNVLVDKADWLKENKVSVLVSNTDERYSGLPQVPNMVEVGRDADARQILNLYSSTAKLGRAIMAPPGVPPERIATLRKAFDEMVKDPEFLAEIKKRQLVEFDAMSGEALQKSILETLDIPPSAIARAAQARER
jgi:tripartite-type tricarboxylate transporter receptor subunit TctC